MALSQRTSFVIERPLPSQIKTDLPLRNAMEACWRAYVKFGLQNCVIDIDQQVVQGQSSRSLRSNGKMFTAQFEEIDGAYLISPRVDEMVAGNVDFGRNKRLVAEISNQIEEELKLAPDAPVKSSLQFKPVIAPIASPRGGPVLPSTDNPVYGIATSMERFRQGSTLLLCGVIGVLCFPFALLVLVHGIKTLRQYEKVGDGSKIYLEKSMAITGTILGAIGVLLPVLLALMSL